MPMNREKDIHGNDEQEPQREHPGDKRYERPPETEQEPMPVEPQLDPETKSK